VVTLVPLVVLGVLTHEPHNSPEILHPLLKKEVISKPLRSLHVIKEFNSNTSSHDICHGQPLILQISICATPVLKLKTLTNHSFGTNNQRSTCWHWSPIPHPPLSSRAAYLDQLDELIIIVNNHRAQVCSTVKRFCLAFFPILDGLQQNNSKQAQISGSTFGS
jgi:hypothetical protein